MSSLMPIGSKPASALFDFMNAVETFNATTHPGLSEREKVLLKASLINRITMLGFSVAEIAALLKGASSETLSFLKTFELVPRLAEIPLRAAMEARASDGTALGRMRAVEKGLLAPLFDVARVFTQAVAYAEEAPLGENRELVEEAQKASKFFSTIRAGAEIHILTGTMHSVYEGLINSLYRARLITEGSAAEMPALEEPADIINLLSLSSIPVELHNDSVFSRYVCPITLSPIRHPVGDPNGYNIYERSAALDWVTRNRTSPTTRAPLDPDQLIAKPRLQRLIDNRLRMHEQNLRACLASALRTKVDIELQSAADLENPHN